MNWLTYWLAYNALRVVLFFASGRRVILVFASAPRVVLLFASVPLVVLLFAWHLERCYSSSAVLNRATFRLASWMVLLFVRGVDIVFKYSRHSSWSWSPSLTIRDAALERLATVFSWMSSRTSLLTGLLIKLLSCRSLWHHPCQLIPARVKSSDAS